jgi:hypothetical protein
MPPLVSKIKNDMVNFMTDGSGGSTGGVLGVKTPSNITKNIY